MDAGLRQQRMRSLDAHFWSYVTKTETCWLWRGDTKPNGYGTLMVDKRPTYAHRLAYELTYGPMLPGLHCLHHCDTPACVRPDHLFLGSHGDNMRDMVAKRRHIWHVSPEKMPRGERQPRAKLTDAAVREIRRLHAEDGWSRVALAHAFGVNKSTIERIIRGETWTHII